MTHSTPHSKLLRESQVSTPFSQLIGRCSEHCGRVVSWGCWVQGVEGLELFKAAIAETTLVSKCHESLRLLMFPKGDGRRAKANLLAYSELPHVQSLPFTEAHVRSAAKTVMPTCEFPGAAAFHAWHLLFFPLLLLLLLLLRQKKANKKATNRRLERKLCLFFSTQAQIRKLPDASTETPSLDIGR